MSLRLPEITRECHKNPVMWIIARSGAKATLVTRLGTGEFTIQYRHAVAGKIYGVEIAGSVWQLTQARNWRTQLAYQLSGMRSAVKDRARKENPNPTKL